jgi:hypothetical protein
MGDTITMRVSTCGSGLFVILGITLIILVSGPSPPFSPEITALLQNNAIERWENHPIPSGQKYRTDRTSPLVTQAKIYANLLNPPALPKPKTTDKPVLAESMTRTAPASILPRVQATPQKVSPRFKVHATSVFAKHPERSMALISKPGKGMFWIRPGDMLGYLKVTQIHKDAVVYAFKDRVGQVAWEPSSIPVSQRPRSDASSRMAMDLPNSPGPSPLPPVSASPLPSRLGTPKKQRTRPMSPRRGR